MHGETPSRGRKIEKQGSTEGVDRNGRDVVLARGGAIIAAIARLACALAAGGVAYAVARTLVRACGAGGWLSNVGAALGHPSGAVDTSVIDSAAAHVATPAIGFVRAVAVALRAVAGGAGIRRRQGTTQVGDKGGGGRRGGLRTEQSLGQARCAATPCEQSSPSKPASHTHRPVR